MTDKPLLLRDDPLPSLIDDDRFRHEAYERVLTRLIADVDAPFVLGLYGRWGAGKSTIARQLQATFSHNKNDSAFVYIDAWRFQRDSFRRQFLLNSETELSTQGACSIKVATLLDESRTTPLPRKWNWPSWKLVTPVVIIAGLVTAGLYALLAGIDAQNPELSLITLVVIPLALQVLDRGPDVLVREGGTITQSPPVSADRFERIFRQHILAELKRRGIRKAVTVVDNLDRLQSDQVVEILGSIKTFMEVPDSPFVFLVCCDHEAIQRHVASQYEAEGNDSDQYAAEFLRKFFNVTIPISTFYKDEMRTFANEELRKLGLSDQLAEQEMVRVQQMAALAFSESPRRIKQFLNNLAARVLVANERIQSGILNLGGNTLDVPLLARVMIIEDKWPQMYKRVQERPDRLNDATLTDEVDGDKLDPDLWQFLQATEDLAPPPSTIRAYLALKQTEDEASLADYFEFRIEAENGNAPALLKRFQKGDDAERLARIRSVDLDSPGGI